MYDYNTLIANAIKSSNQSCGQSDVLFLDRLQASFENILNNAPEQYRNETEAALIKHGYERDYNPYEPSDNECSITGIEEDSCPCGRHP